MPKPEKSIAYKQARALNIGRISSCVESTVNQPGLLLGCPKGLYHLDDFNSRLKRIRNYPVNFIVRGDDGIILYELAEGQGRLAVLDGFFKEIRADFSLARKINPLAFWNSGIITIAGGQFVHVNVVTDRKIILADFESFISMGPFVPTHDGFEFIAIRRDTKWSTYLYRLVLSPGAENHGQLKITAKLEDPLITHHFIRLAEEVYLTIPQNRPLFLIMRLYNEDSELRVEKIIPIAGETHPSGMVKAGDSLITACADCLVVYSISL